jgi:hypothetical protein
MDSCFPPPHTIQICEGAEFVAISCPPIISRKRNRTRLTGEMVGRYRSNGFRVRRIRAPRRVSGDDNRTGTLEMLATRNTCASGSINSFTGSPEPKCLARLQGHPANPDLDLALSILKHPGRQHLFPKIVIDREDGKSHSNPFISGHTL